MPFVKGQAANPNGRPKGSKNLKTIEWESIVRFQMQEGADRYRELTTKLSLGQEISEPETDFMDRWERMLEYHQPKLARTELVGDEDHPLEISLNLSPEQLTAISTAASRLSGNTGKK